MSEFKDWADIPAVTSTGGGWVVRINGSDVFDSINQYGVKTLRSFDIVSGLSSREEAESFRIEWLKKQLPQVDQDVALAREAALREELATSQFCQERDALQQRLTVAEQRDTDNLKLICGLVEYADNLLVDVNNAWSYAGSTGDPEIHKDEDYAAALTLISALKPAAEGEGP